MATPLVFPVSVDDEFDFRDAPDDDGRLHALANVYRVLRALEGADPDILQLDDTDEDENNDERYRVYLDILNKYTSPMLVDDALYGTALHSIRNRAFWADVALAFPSPVARQFFMEQLIRHRYLRHRAFFPTLYNDEAGIPVEWVACDVHATAVYTPEMPTSFMLMHQDELLEAHVLTNVRAPAALSFEKLHALLDRPLYSGGEAPAAWDDETNDLRLQTEYDPIYFDDIFSSDTANAAARAALVGMYAPPLLIHDMLLRNQRVQIKGGEGGLGDIVGYLNDILPSASAPYRAIVRDMQMVEAAYFLRQLYRVLSLVF